ncbi:Chaperone protein dnaJ 20, chloroplastic [Sesamum alatum]|uniref:Chaperone protein dnaJ 20, chloroplastic n=1 Tax=Sesamum alatum TaxID=300844 RepID=A0AAE1Z290_9LAMI|nr:Chaperone protein dnaJ 20, chloroplastic [Sesamum alatum]
MMSAHLVSTAEPTLYLCSKPKNSVTDNVISSISFSSQVTKSRISVRNQSRPGRARAACRIQAFYAPVETRETLYQVLGITEAGSGSSFSDIKKAYKEMARKYHPDVSPPERVDEYTRRFILVHEAYETLSNPEKRASYDRDLAAGSAFGFSAARKSRQYHNQGMEKKREWKNRWEVQLDELKRRGENSRPRMSWGARIRNQS